MTGKGGLQVIKESKGKSFCEAYKKPLQAIEKDLEDFEWLKSKIGLKVLDSLPTHDKFELLRILGVDMSEWENL